MRIGQSSWSVEVSDDWIVTEHPECITLELSDHAALQASSVRKRGGPVSEQDLHFSEEQRDEWGVWAHTTCGDFKGIVYECELDGATWKRWFLRNGSTLLYITYNGTHQAAVAEREAVVRVLRTAQVESW